MSRPLKKVLSFREVSQISLKDLFSFYSATLQGLSNAEIKQRQHQYGLNRLIEQKKESILLRFIKILTDLFSLLLFFAAFLAFLSNMAILGWAIVIIIFMNAGFTFYQNWQAMEAMKALKKWIPEFAHVIRDGLSTRINVEDLVPGDIIELNEGDRVPADARLIESTGLYTIEIPLTGEFEPVLKQPQIDELQNESFQNSSRVQSHSLPPPTPILTSANIVFQSTSVAQGKGTALVYATGMQTRFGQIADLTQTIQAPPSPLQKEITLMAKYSFEMSFIVGVIFFCIAYFGLQLDLVNSVMFIIGVMIACVPEGLQATISSVLAINVMKMARQNVLVKRLSIVQGLGSVTLITTDKTGTLTKGEMTVNKLWTYDHTVDVTGVGYYPTGEFQDAEQLVSKEQQKYLDISDILRIGALCNSAKLQSPTKDNLNWSIVGDPTDGAMLVAAIKFGIILKECLDVEPRLAFFPFDSDRLLVSSVHQHRDQIRIYSKGAPGAILERCNLISMNNKVLPLGPNLVSQIRQKRDEFAHLGLRVIAIGMRDLTSSSYDTFTSSDYKLDSVKLRDHLEQDMTFLGLIAMKDTPRVEVKPAIDKIRQAGIKIAMITGDYGPTAEAIAREVGIFTSNDQGCVIQSDNLRLMSDSEISQLIQKGNIIFSRATPDQKLQIVKAARAIGEVVAVTGDGANDAPALKQADIGIAMGVAGTDIAKEASDIILTDDSFASIVSAIEGGRSIWMNLQKFIFYVYSHNWGELIPYILFILLGVPIPILAIHILLIDLLIEIPPSVALSRELPNPNLMTRPPTKPKDHLFSRDVFLQSLFIGFIEGLLAFLFCVLTWLDEGWIWGQTLNSLDPVYLHGIAMTYATIVMGQVGNLLSCRNIEYSSISKQISSNPFIFFSILWQIGILCLTLYLPGVGQILGTNPLDAYDWIFLGLTTIFIIILNRIWNKLIPYLHNKKK